MQVIGLIGYVDKHDFALNMLRVINIMDRSVLLIDGTFDKKYKYVIPAIDANSKAYITQYSDVDFAVGFDNYEEFETYAQEHGVDIEKYDYVIMDIDSAETYKKFARKEFTKKYMFIDTNILSVAKNKEIVKTIRESMPDVELRFTKVLYKAYLSRASENYIENQLSLYNVIWQDEVYEIMIDEQDRMVAIDSQFSGIIQTRKHTKMYLLALVQLVSALLEEDPKKVLKKVKRRRN